MKWRDEAASRLRENRARDRVVKQITAATARMMAAAAEMAAASTDYLEALAQADADGFDVTYVEPVESSR